MNEENCDVWHAWLTPIRKYRKRLSNESNKGLAGDRKRAADRLAQHVAHYERALERLRECRPELASGCVDVTLTDEDVDHLMAAVCKDTAGYELKDTQRYIVEGLTAGVRELGWDLPVPTPIAVNTTESSRVTPESFALLAQYDALDQAFWDDLHSDVVDDQSPSMSRDAGQLLFSLVFHSGVCNKQWLHRVPESIRQGAGVGEGVVWLDLGTPIELDTVDSVDRRRRQFLAPVTQLLLRRWYQKRETPWPRERSGGAFRPAGVLLKQFTSELCKRAGIAEISVRQCLSMSSANLATTLPNLLVHYSESSQLGPPMSEHNWLRLLSDRKPATPIKALKTDGATQFERDHSDISLSGEYPEQRALFSELRRCVEVQPVSAAIASVEGFLQKEQIAPIVQLMAYWAHHLLVYGGPVKKRLGQGSVVRYLNWIRPLINYADDLQNPFSVDEDQWQAIYDEVIGNSRGVAAKRAGRLAAFHEFLEDAYGMPPVDVAGGTGEQQSDARILTPREYERARRYLHTKAKDNDRAACQEILLILGYRCGLRRGEAFSRRFGDFLGMDDPIVEGVELLVRPNKMANIKSEVGTRRLPLKLLLTDEEFSLLREFYRQRRMLVTGAVESQPLFADIPGGHWPAAKAHLFDPLTRLLQDITGDGRFRFHSLRHSFVTMTFLRLMEASPGEHLLQKWREGEEGGELLPSMTQPLWKGAGLTDTGQSLWLLAMWAGHASPALTLECYSHLLDWLMASFIRKRHNPRVSLKSQSKLLGQTSRALEKWRQRHGLRNSQTSAKDLADIIAGNWPAAGRRSLLGLRDYEEVCVERLEEDQGPTRQVGFMDPYNLMLWCEQNSVESGKSELQSLEAAAALVGISVDEAGRWQRNARYLMGMRTSRTRHADKKKPAPLDGGNRARFSRDDEKIHRPLEEKNVNRGLPSVSGFVAPPKTRPGREHAMHYFQRLIDWYAQDPESALCAMGSVIDNVQRSHTPIRPRSVSDQRSLYAVLCRLELKSRTTIRIRHTPTRSTHKLRQRWAQRFNTEVRHIKCVEVAAHLKTGTRGRSQLVVDPPAALYRNQRQNLFWNAFRFALMSAYVVCADPDSR